MLKYALFAAALIFGIHYGVTYLTSEDFQVYGDQNNAAWTCQVNNVLGHFYITMSHYDKALALFDRSAKRCPKTSVAESAEFEVAVCLENLGRRSEAREAYRKYVEKYKNTKRARIADKAIDYLGP